MGVLTSLTQKNRTWRQFSNTERWLLLQALVLLPLIALSLKLWGLNVPPEVVRAAALSKLKRTYSLLSFPQPKPASCSLSQLRTTASVVKIAAKYYAWATCLRKSLVLWFLLRRQGIAAELKIGTRFDRGEFQAHAWVEYQGYVVGDRQGVQKHFTTFDRLNLYVEQKN